MGLHTGVVPDDRCTRSGCGHRAKDHDPATKAVEVLAGDFADITTPIGACSKACGCRQFEPTAWPIEP